MTPPNFNVLQSKIVVSFALFVERKRGTSAREMFSATLFVGFVLSLSFFCFDVISAL